MPHPFRDAADPRHLRPRGLPPQELLPPFEQQPHGRRVARAAHDLVRTLSPRLRDDRPLGPDIEAVADAIRDGALLAAVDSAVGELE